MAKSKAQKPEEIAPDTVDESQAPEETTSSKKMSKAQAEAIVKKYDGINGVAVPEELKQAKAVLRG